MDGANVGSFVIELMLDKGEADDVATDWVERAIICVVDNVSASMNGSDVGSLGIALMLDKGEADDWATNFNKEGCDGK